MRPTRQLRFFAAAFFLTAAAGHTQQKPQTTVDLKPFGIAADLFTDQADSRYAQRGIATLFWIGNDRLAVAFSTNLRWTPKENPEPLHVRLITLDSGGRRQKQRDWDIPAEGPSADSFLALLPAAGKTILAIHESGSSSDSQNTIPEGNLIQVLNADLSLQQNFYVPATSVPVTELAGEAELVLQQFFADNHSTLTWWSGNPLKADQRLDLPRGSGDLLVGPSTAARLDCLPTISDDPQGRLCSGIRVFRVGASAWYYTTPAMNAVPTPRTFLTPASLLISLHLPESKSDSLLIAYPDGRRTPLIVLPGDQQVLSVTSVAAQGKRFSFETTGEVGLCGALSLFCKGSSKTYVFDVAEKKMIFEESSSGHANQSALAPDGRQLAILDKGKLTIFTLP